jgi:hypothetical protein
MEGGRLVASSCDHCHDLLLHGEGRNALETLNGFGRDYLEEGRSGDALATIRERDSDGDGWTNDEEISLGRHPGSELSRPGQEVAPFRTVTLDAIRSLPSHTQFLLVNNIQQRFDEYTAYRGVTLEELFSVLEIDLDGATGLTFIAPDGYRKSLPVEYVVRVFPKPLFHSGLGIGALGRECGFVTYPPQLPDGVSAGLSLPGVFRLILAFERDGEPLEPSELDVADGRIVGEGPLRIVVPQESPGKPDRGSRYSPSNCSDDFDYRPDADHNAGSMVRGVIAIRIDPMPVGVEEFDYMNGGWAYADAGELIVYGHEVGHRGG